MRGITRTKAFKEKGLAAYAVNVGMRCGNHCTYCSTPSVVRMHACFGTLGKSPFAQGYAIVDPDIVGLVEHDARSLRNRGLIQMCTLTDAWAQEARDHDLGRRCLEAVLPQPGWTVRALTKNAEIVKDFDVVEKYRERVLVGLSLTGTPDQEAVLTVIEPYASSIGERMAVLCHAHERGLRTFGMLCPLLPGIGDRPEQINELARFAAQCSAEEVFAEAVNPRGRGLILTQQALAEHGYASQAQAIGAIRNKTGWSKYVVGLLKNLQSSMRRFSDIDKLRFLLYPGGLTPEALADIGEDGSGVVWLGGRPTPASRADVR